MSLTFEWDEAKAKANLKKHRVAFEEARTVFGDPLSVTIPDPEHSDEEMRHIDIGMSIEQRLLIVVYSQTGHTIRIISSRKATKAELKEYESYGA